MNRESNENKLLSKVIDMCLLHDLEESYLYLNFLNNQVKIYKSHLQFLEDTKPFFFQKKKIIVHCKKIEECEIKIRDIYLKMGQEIEKIIKINDMIN